MEKLIGFGASSVEGVGDTQGGFFQRLERKLADAGRPRECLNQGKGGDTTRDMLARLDRVRPHLPGKVIVLLGSNDMPRDRDGAPANRVSLDTYVENLEQLLSVLGGPEAIFVSSFAVCSDRTGVQSVTFATYMKVALKIATRRGMMVWDLYAESLKWGDRYLGEDGLHYNDAGHEMMAERLLVMVG